MDLSATPEGAAALADGIALMIEQGRDSGLLALYLYRMGRAEASWVASWTEALRASEN